MRCSCFNIYIFLLVLLPGLCHCLLDGLYCGKQNCYDVLGVKRESTRHEIAKAYRSLARKHHPDSHRGEEAKALAEEKFRTIAQAYEILRDEESRNDYDYMLDNPNAYYAHYYRYYRHRVTPKVDVRLVIVVTVTIISFVQYYSGWQRYKSAISYFASVPKYRNKAIEMAKDEIQEKIYDRKGKDRLSKDQIKDELERIIRRVVEENMDVKGGYAKPTICDVLWLQILMFPYKLLSSAIWYVQWFWRFTLMGQPFGREEKLYLIRRYMRLGINEFDAQSNDEIEKLLKLELWKRENFTKWNAEQEEERKKKLAENPRYKSYRRYMKNHGTGRMTFAD